MNTPENKIKKPAPLNKGDTIGIVAPSSSFDKENFKKGINFLRKIGYKIKYERSIFNECWEKPGHNKQRAEQINRMFADKDVKAIMCAKGGTGSFEIIPYLDENIIKKNIKVFIGYSDITIILLYLQNVANMVVFHGPVVSSEIFEDMNPVTLDYLLKSISQQTPLGAVMFPLLTSFKPGKASGILIGGNISLIVSAIGTPYDIDTRGKILFLEEVSEDHNIIRDYFKILAQNNKFKEIKGLLLGEMTFCYDDPEKLKELINEFFGDSEIPVLFGFPSGHTETSDMPHITLPLGVYVTIDSDNALLSINEQGVHEK